MRISPKAGLLSLAALLATLLIGLSGTGLTSVELFHQTALALKTRIYGTHHVEVARQQGELGRLYLEQGRYAGSEPLFIEAEATLEQFSKSNRLDLAQAHADRGELFLKQGRYPQAAERFDKVLTIRRSQLGAEHPDTLTALCFLGIARLKEGHPEAGDLLENALAFRVKLFGENHPEVAHSLAALGKWYLFQSRLEEARAAFVRSLAIRETALGTTHPDVAASLIQLGTWHQLHRNRDAGPLFERALAIREKAFGHAHPEVAEALLKVAESLIEDGKATDALDRIVRAMSIREEMIGAQHPIFAEALLIHGRLYLNQDQYKQAKASISTALASFQAVFGADHPLTSDSQGQLAQVFKHSRQFAQAESAFNKQLVIQRKYLSPDHPQVARTLVHLAQTYQSLGRLDEAASHAAKAFALLEDRLGHDHLVVAQVITGIADIYLEQKRLKEAENLIARQREILKRLFSRPHPLLAENQLQYGLLRAGQGRNDEAAMSFREAIAIQEAAVGTADHPEVALYQTFLGDHLGKQGKAEEAGLLLKAAQSTFSRFNSLIAKHLHWWLAEQHRSRTHIPWLKDAYKIAYERIASKGWPYTEYDGYEWNSFPYIETRLISEDAYEEVATLFKEELDTLRKHDPNQHNLAATLNNQAVFYSEQALRGLAEPLYWEALDSAEKYAKPQQVASILNNLGASQLELQQYDKAESLIRRSLALKESARLQRMSALVTALDNLAILKQRQGQEGEAASLRKEAIATRNRSAQVDLTGQNRTTITRDSAGGMKLLNADIGLLKKSIDFTFSPRFELLKGLEAQRLSLLHIDQKAYDKLAIPYDYYPCNENECSWRPRVQKGIETTQINGLIANYGLEDYLFSYLSPQARQQSQPQRREYFQHEKRIDNWSQQKTKRESEPGNYARDLVQWAIILAGLDKPAEAEQQLNKALVTKDALELHGEYSEIFRIFHTLAVFHGKQGQYAQAESYIRQADGTLKNHEQYFGKLTERFRYRLLATQAQLQLQQKHFDLADVQIDQAISLLERVEEPFVVAASLNALALRYTELGDNKRAEPLLRKAVRICASNRDLKNSLLKIAMNLAILFQRQGRHTEIASLFSEESIRFARDSFLKELEALRQSLNIASTEAQSLPRLLQLHRSGHLAEMKRHLMPAFNFLRRNHTAAEAYNDLGVILASQGNNDLAITLLEQVLPRLREQANRAANDLNQPLNNLAVLHYKQGQHSQAYALYKTIADIQGAQATEKSRDAWVRYSLADGDALSAQELIMSSFKNHKDHNISKLQGILNPVIIGSAKADKIRGISALPTIQPLLVDDYFEHRGAVGTLFYGLPQATEVAQLRKLALQYRNAGQLALAEQALRDIVAITDRMTPKRDHEYAMTLEALALCLMDQYRYVEAEKLLKQATKHGKPGRLLTILYFRQGQYEKALQVKDKSLLKCRECNQLSDPEGRYSNSLEILAMAYATQGKPQLAEPLLKEVLNIRKKALGPNHSKIAKTLDLQAYMYQLQGNENKALQTLRKSIRIQSGHRAFFGIPDRSGTEAATADADTFTRHAQLIGGRLAKLTKASRSAVMAEAFVSAQQARQGSTGAALVQMAARAAAGDAVLSNTVRHLQDAIHDWRRLDTELTEALSSEKRDQNKIGKVREEMAERNAFIAEQEATLKRDYPRYAELMSPDPLTLAEAQALLKPEEALLNYLVTDKESLLWIIRRDRVEMLRLAPGRAELVKQITALRRSVDMRLGVLPEFAFRTAHGLYQSLLAPAVSSLEGVSHLIVVADGPMQSLPFGLLTSAPATNSMQVPWLIRQYAFTHLPTASALRALRSFDRKQNAQENFIGFGDPLLEGKPGEARRVTMAQIFARGALADTKTVRRLERLPDTAYELKDMAKLLNADEGNIWLGKAATETRVKSANLEAYRVIAFATHGLMAGDFPGLAEPALVLTPPDKPSQEDDGVLTASEVAGLSMNADMVILSACNTAAPDGRPGAEGFSGLAKAFFYAGSRSLLVSHWAVDSKATVSLSTRMLAMLNLGLTRAEALRRAMVTLADEPATSHPALWAPFVVVGEGG